MVNSPGTELAADINATTTSIDVLDASKLPAAPNLVTVGGDESAETIRYTGKTGNTLIGCTRGFEGTAKGWASGTQAARNHTAYDYEAGRANIADSLVSARAYADGALDDANTYTDEKISAVTLNYVRQPGYAVTTGTVSAYVATLNPAPTTLPDGFGITIVPHVTNAAGATLNINGLGAAPLKKQDGTAYAVGGLLAGKPYSFRRVGSDFLADSGGREVSINGQTEVSALYGEAIASYDPVQLTLDVTVATQPATLPVSSSNGISYSPNGTFLAVAQNAAPYITIYKLTDGIYVKIADPTVVPTSAGRGVSWSSDGVYLAVACISSPYLVVYKRSGDIFTKLADPDILPSSNGNGVAFSPDGLHLAVAHSSSPFLTIYKRNGDVFNKLANPSTLPPNQGNGVGYSADGVYMAVAHAGSPNVTIYKRNGDVYTKLNNPSLLPTGTGQNVAFSPDGSMFAVAHVATPFMTVYNREGDVFTKLPNPASLPPGTGAYGISYSPDNAYLLVGTNATPFVAIYKNGGGRLTKLKDPEVIPTGRGGGIAFSPTGGTLAMVYDTSPFLTLYTQSKRVYKSSGAMSDIVEASGAGYALENGSMGDTKKIALIWR